VTDRSRSFVDRRILITGGGSGIGRATGERLAAAGAAVAVADLRSHLAEETATAITAGGGRGLAVQCDVADEGSVADATALAVEWMGGLDGVLAGAGIATPGATHLLTLADWEKVIGVNLTGVFLTLKHAIPHLLANDHSEVVTIGSIASFVVAGQNAPSYPASKAAVVALTRSVAVEYASRGLRANCVCPGLVDTNILAHSRELRSELTSPVEGTFGYLKEAPIARHASPDEIAATIEFLLSRDSSFVTGASVLADGGYTSI
jgi:3-oxoacyl-[acyl-carrier protein] reductase